jgi:glycosyltransferase involved in cell wall biosynthesis
LKIAVNTRLLLPDKLEGIGWFTFETLRRIVASHPEVKFYFLFDRSPDPSFIFGPNVEAVVLKPPARHPFLYVIWFEWAVKRALDKIQPDLFLSPDGYLSLGSTIPSLSVLHDLNFEHFPDDLPLLARWHYRSFFPRYAQKAARIATVSEFSKQDIMQQYGVPAEKIDVVYNGANELFSPLTIEEQQAVRQRYSEGHPYFLFVGALHPRKNLVRLFQAFDLYRSQSNQQVKLLIVGEKMFRTKAISQT